MSVCPSVCPSQLSKRRNISLSCHSYIVAPSFQFPGYSAKIPTGSIFPQLRSQMGWGVKNCDFQRISHFIWETIKDRVIVTVECQRTRICDRSNGSIFSYLEWALNQSLRACHYSTWNILETVQGRNSYNGILIGIYTRPTQRCNFQ